MYRYISFELYQKLSKVLKENNLNFKKIDCKPKPSTFFISIYMYIIEMKKTDYVNQISYMVQQEIELFLINYKTYDLSYYYDIERKKPH